MIARAAMTSHPMPYRDEASASHETNWQPADDALRKRRQRERRAHTAIFGICLAFFLVATMVSRLRPSHWIKGSGATRSIWQEAKEEARFCAAIAFQG